MKQVYVLMLLMISTTASAQKYILIDRKLKQPVQLVDTVSQEQLQKGFFPIDRQSLDSVLGKLEEVRQRLLVVGREKYDEFEWSAGSTTLHCTVTKWTYGDRLNVAISTNTHNGRKSSYYIVSDRKMNKENAAYLKKLFEYIKK